jgi:hypothetical protein
MTQDDLPSISISRLRAAGQVSGHARFAVVSCGGLRRVIGVAHRRFPNNGSWSFFLCPRCSRRARVLKLHDGAVKCSRCVGLPYQCQLMSDSARAARRVEKLEALLSTDAARLHPRPGRIVDRRSRLEVSLRRAKVVIRSHALRGAPAED